MGASGWKLFAGVMMLVYATLLVIAGLAGIFDGDVYFRSDAGQLVILDFVTWGWIHLILGAALGITGGALLLGREWARLGAILLVMGAILLNLLIVAAYPGWSLTFLIFDALLLLSLMVPNSKDET